MLILQTLKKFWFILDLKERFYFIFLMPLIIISGFLEMFSIAAIFLYVSLVSSEQPRRLYYIFEKLGIDNPVIETISKNHMIIVGGVFLIATFVLKNILNFLTSIKLKTFLNHKYIKISSRVYATETNPKFEEILSTKNFNIQRRIMRCWDVFMKSFYPSIDIVISLVTILILWALLVLINFELSVLLALVLIISNVFLILALQKYVNRLSEDQNEIKQDARNIILDTLRAFIDVKLMKRESFFLSKFYNANVNRIQIEKSQFKLKQFPGFVNEITLVFSFFLSVLVCLHSSKIEPHAFIPILTTFGFAGLRIGRLCSKVVVSYQSILLNKMALSELMQVIASHYETAGLSVNHSSPVHLNFTKVITCNGVFFNFKKGQESVLKNVNLKFEKGNFIGVCGPSGAGKTTLMHIVSGLIEPRTGLVEVDGKNIHDKTNIDQWRHKVSYCGFSSALINGSILDNITFEDDNANIDSESLGKLLSIFEIKNTIESLDQKEQTFIENNNHGLSAGQIQRILLARAFYKKPEIAILDEAFANVDNKLSGKILKNIKESYPDITVIYISHDLNSFEICDYVYTIENGTITNCTAFKG